MKILMELFALALDLPRDFFEACLVDHQSSSRIVYYPSLDPNHCAVIERAGEHTDWGCLTILRQDPLVGGLQIKMFDGTWQDVPIVADGLIVNLGDLLPRWTNDKWKATAHRVVKPEGLPSQRTSRLTIPFFGLVNGNTVITCIPSCQTNGQQNYEPIKAGEFFSDHEKYSVYSKEK